MCQYEHSHEIITDEVGNKKFASNIFKPKFWTRDKILPFIQKHLRSANPHMIEAAFVIFGTLAEYRDIVDLPMEINQPDVRQLVFTPTYVLE
jgi:hypothetical protein